MCWGESFAAEVPGATEDDRLAWPLAEAALPDRDTPDDVYDWNQALMDVGATLCLSRNPRCLLCPAQTWCTARKAWFAPEALPLGLAADPGTPAEISLVAETRAEYKAGETGSEGLNGALPEIPPMPVRGKRSKSSKAKAAPEKFEGSRRWFRGRIVDALRALPEGASLSRSDLRVQVEAAGAAVEDALLEDLLRALARDGLVHVKEDGTLVFPQ